MKYKFEEKLRKKDEEFICACKKRGIIGKIIEESFREYSVKVAISKAGEARGEVNIYYRPKTNSYTFSSQEIKDRSIIPTLEKCFYPELFHPPEKNNYQIYIDGSYLEGKVGYGVIILKGGEKIAEFSGQVNANGLQITDYGLRIKSPINNPQPTSARQVLGEIFAAKKAIIWCKENKVDNVSIYYDYEGIKKWATGEWKAKQPLTKGYTDFVRSSKVRVRWNKVISHSGVYWNEKVDKLARKGACGK